MSVLTTSLLKIAPANSVGTAVDAPGPAWTYGSWVQFIASAAAGTVIAGFFLRPVHGGNVWVEVEMGIGPAASEVVIGRFRYYSRLTSNSNFRTMLLPVPVGGISAGDRVSLRTRSQSGTGVQHTAALAYFEGFDGLALEGLGCTQPGAVGASISVNTAAWADSGYTELTSGEPNAISIYGIAVSAPSGEDTTQYEYDVATGGAGSEVVIFTATISRVTAGGNGGPFSHFWLPKVHYLPASTRVSVRVRKSGTNATAITASLLFYNDIFETPMVVNAGPDQNITFGAPLTICGTVTL